MLKFIYPHVGFRSVYFRIVNNNFLDIINHFIVNNCEINFSKEKLKVDILMTVFL